MAATIVQSLLVVLEGGLMRLEHTDKHRQEDLAQSSVNAATVDTLFAHMKLIIQHIGTDAEGWQAVAQFVESESVIYKSDAGRGCLGVLGAIAHLFPAKK